MNLEWMAKANCKSKTKLFFLVEGETTSERRKREYIAKALCRACSVSSECRDYARANGEVGIWGGETSEERYANGYVLSGVVTSAMRRRRLRAQQANKEQ